MKSVVHSAVALVAVLLTAPGAARAQQPTPSRTHANVTQRLQSRLNTRLAKAFAIVERLADDARGRGLSSGWRQAALETLLPLSMETLQQLEHRAVSIDSLAAVARELRDEVDDPSVLGSTDRDLVYTPILPCRFIDTRNVGGKINGVRSFSALSSGATYGGAAACVVPVSPAVPAAIAMNVTVVDTSTSGAPGFVAIKPTAGAPVTSLLNWYEAGVSVQAANQGVVSTDQTGGSAGSFVVETSGPVHIIVDIFGVFKPPQATALETEVRTTTLGIATGQTLAGVSPVCTTGFSIVGGGCLANNDFVVLRTSAQAGNAWICTYFNLGFGASFTVQAICARVPGR